MPTFMKFIQNFFSYPAYSQTKIQFRNVILYDETVGNIKSNPLANVILAKENENVIL